MAFVHSSHVPSTQRPQPDTENDVMEEFLALLAVQLLILLAESAVRYLTRIVRANWTVTPLLSPTS
jgi:hypothetical protein